MKEKEQKAVRIQLIMVQGKNALGIIARPLSLFTPLLRLTQHRLLLLTPPPPSALDSKVERERLRESGARKRYEGQGTGFNVRQISLRHRHCVLFDSLVWRSVDRDGGGVMMLRFESILREIRFR